MGKTSDAQLIEVDKMPPWHFWFRVRSIMPEAEWAKLLDKATPDDDEKCLKAAAAVRASFDHLMHMEVGGRCN